MEDGNRQSDALGRVETTHLGYGRHGGKLLVAQRYLQSNIQIISFNLHAANKDLEEIPSEKCFDIFLACSVTYFLQRIPSERTRKEKNDKKQPQHVR